MKLAVPRLQLLGAIWFAAAAGICFPLSVAAFPGPGSLQLGQILPGVWAGLSVYGVPAAIAGVLLVRGIVASNAGLAFVLGALAVLFAAILTGPWLELVGGRFTTLEAFLSASFIGALGQVAIDVVLLRGLPFLFGGLFGIGLRATVLKYSGSAT